MTSRKLSESDKKTILDLYRQPGETTSTLAERYGVSNSTISRLLKSTYSEAEYEALIQQKRSARSGESVVEEAPIEAPVALEPPTPQPEVVSPPADSSLQPVRRLRKRSSASTQAEPELTVESATEERVQQEFVQQEVLPIAAIVEEVKTIAAEVNSSDAGYVAEATVLQEMLGEELLDQDDDLNDDDDLDDDLDDEDDDLDDEELGGSTFLVTTKGDGKTLVQVMPLAEASLPRTCYLVVDRSAELIARPLKEFGDLGQIPEDEFQEKTLPIFDNHRVAKRYSNPRTQRVIKLPDSRVLQKTTSHLQAKGITRLLIDGQVYSLN